VLEDADGELQIAVDVARVRVAGIGGDRELVLRLPF
jgi:hypothetical protein